MIHEFGPFSLDQRERVLRRNGDLVPITPKVLDILLFMVQHSGRVLTKEQIIHHVWPDTIVEESNLARNVSTLRKVLAQPYIETIPWRGYRFNVPVRQVDRPTVIDSLAVLPFFDENPDPGAEYLSDGITETLINRVSLVPNLKVMSRNSVFRYKVREPNGVFAEATVVGRELDVRAVLTGRIRHMLGMLIVNVELIDAGDNRQLWGAQYKRELSDIFSLQEGISRGIVEHLRLKLPSNETPRPSRRHTENAEAYHLYLKGRFALNKLTLDGIREGLELFQQATAKDPNYSLAYTGQVDCHIGLNNPVEAKKAAIKALELDPSQGEARASLGFLAFLHDWDWRKAEREFQHAIDLNPNYAQAHQWYAVYLAKMERHDEALFEARRAQQLDPLSLPMHLTCGIVLCFARQYDLAIQEFRKVIELDTNFAAAHSLLGLAYTYRRKCDDAIAEFRKAAELAPDSSGEAFAKTQTAYCYAVCGRTKHARKMLGEIANLPTTSSYVMGTIHAQLGDHRRAMDLLERAYHERNYQVVSLRVDPALDPVRSSRRFRTLLSRVGLDT
jgi:TolB-like protein/Flp pilus assembly protein TadD